MDEASFLQIESFWPDVSRPFSRIVPDGCFLVRTEDDWVAEAALRTRTVDLARGARCPDLEDLVEEAREDAERRGWTPIDDAMDRSTLELEGVHCEIGAAKVRLASGPIKVLRVFFRQPWPKDAGAPVETSEMFQNLVRKLLQIGGDPERLTKIVTLDGSEAGAFRVDVLFERVRLPRSANIGRRLKMTGFTLAEDGAWVSGTTTSPPFDIAARVREDKDRLEVEMTKVRAQKDPSSLPRS